MGTFMKLVQVEAMLAPVSGKGMFSRLSGAEMGQLRSVSEFFEKSVRPALNSVRAASELENLIPVHEGLANKYEGGNKSGGIGHILDQTADEMRNSFRDAISLGEPCQVSHF